MPRRKSSATNSSGVKTWQKLYKHGELKVKQDEFEATKGLINRLSKKYLATDTTQPRRSPRNLRQHRESKSCDSDEPYQADAECSTTTSSDSDNGQVQRTQTSDQYDFETSEEFLKLRFSPDKKSSKKKHNKKQVKQNATKPVYRYNPVGGTKRPAAKSTIEDKPAKIRRVSLADKSISSILKETELGNSNKSNKRKSRVSFDSGVFMTPSPFGHNVCSSSKNSPSVQYSTPSNAKKNIKQTTTKPCMSNDITPPNMRLGDLLMKPPNLSPVKRINADISLEHGVLVNTPMELEYEEIPQHIKTAKTDDLMESFSAHEISKTYENKSGFSSAKKSKKTQKEKRVSVSRWDLVAAKKNEEFEEIENFEFSME